MTLTPSHTGFPYQQEGKHPAEFGKKSEPMAKHSSSICFMRAWMARALAFYRRLFSGKLPTLRADRGRSLGAHRRNSVIIPFFKRILECSTVRATKFRIDLLRTVLHLMKQGRVKPRGFRSDVRESFELVPRLSLETFTAIGCLSDHRVGKRDWHKTRIERVVGVGRRNRRWMFLFSN